MSGENKVLTVLGIGCAGIIVCGVLCIFGGLIWLGTGPEGGVRVGNTMEDYAVEYLDENSIVEPGETIHAYYDVTISLDSTECAILTDRRLIYHRNSRNTEMAREDIALVESEDLGMMGEGITVEDVNGDVIYIEIAALNNAPVFRSALERAVEENEETQEMPDPEPHIPDESDSEPDEVDQQVDGER